MKNIFTFGKLDIGNSELPKVEIAAASTVESTAEKRTLNSLIYSMNRATDLLQKQGNLDDESLNEPLGPENWKKMRAIMREVLPSYLVNLLHYLPLMVLREMDSVDWGDVYQREDIRTFVDLRDFLADDTNINTCTKGELEDFLRRFDELIRFIFGFNLEYDLFDDMYTITIFL